MFNDKKHILFDLDGTLIDSKQGISNTIRKTLTKYGYPAPVADDLDWCIGPPLHECYRQLTGSQDDAHIEEIVAHNRKLYSEEGIFDCCFFTDIEKVIAELAITKNIYLATSKPRPFAELILKHLKVDHHFKGIYGSEFTGERENKTDLIAYILEMEKIAVESAVMVGDRKYDIIAAKNHTMHVIAVKWGFAAMEELLEHTPHHICSHPHELLEILR